MPIRGVPTAVLRDVLQPLDVRLGITVDLTDEAGVFSNIYSSVGWETSLENRPVRGPLCQEGGKEKSQKHGFVLLGVR